MDVPYNPLEGRTMRTCSAGQAGIWAIAKVSLTHLFFKVIAIKLWDQSGEIDEP